MTSRADLHIHSKYSNRPSEWFLRRIGAPESYVEPETIYKRCKARGMDFVTITDHNRIEGALDIAHLPGTFISSEITTYFPEDGCKVHCLVYGIAEEEFERIQEVRESIYELREFLFEEDILHSIAHPLYRINNRLSLEHIEKLLLLFNRFEAINGSERQDVSRLTCALMESLTEKKIEELANNYDIEPVGPAPWIKSLSGGSDDHSGIYAGAACTVTPKAETVGEFLGHLDALRYQPAGRGGSCLRFAHSIYHIAYQYYRSRLFDSSKPRNKLVGKILKRLVGKDMHEEKSFKDRLLSLMGKITYSVKHNRASGVERDIMEQLQRFWERSTEEPPAGPNAVPSCGQDEKTFEKACRISQEFAWIFVRSCIAHGRQGEILKTVQTLAALGPVALGIAPYLAAFRSLHKGKALERKVVSRFGLARASDKGPKRALLTERCAAEDFALGLFAPDSVSATTIISCVNGVGKKQKPVVNFEPVGALDFRTRGNERIVFPPFLEIIEFLEKKEFKEIVVTDPGLLGLTGLLASRLLGIRAVGVYREKSVQRVMAATGDETLERLANQYLAFFYGQMDMVFVSSEGQRKNLSGAGFNPQKLRVIHCGSSHDESAEQPTCGARAAVG